MNAMASHNETQLSRFYTGEARAGEFIIGVQTTGIYCLPTCRAKKPLRENVRVFVREEDAKAAGLRACKKCRPDHFYAGFDPELEALVAALAKVRDCPADFRTIPDIATAVHVGVTRLHALMRRHYYMTPARYLTRARVTCACRMIAETGSAGIEAGLEAGYESTSAYYENFRAEMGMTPGEWARLGTADTFTVMLPHPQTAGTRYRAEDALRVWGRDPHSRIERVRGNSIEKAVLCNGRPVLLAITFDGGHPRSVGGAVCRITLLDGGPMTALVARAAHRIALRLLGLPGEAGEFARHLSAHPRLLPLIAGRENLRIPLTADVFEAVVWAIVGQQVNLPFAYALRNRLTNLSHGLPADTENDTLLPHPTASQMACLDVNDLLPHQFSRRKAEYLIDTARLIVSGELDLERFAVDPVMQTETRLLAVRGLGPWSVNYLLMRGVGCADCVPLGDTGLTMGLKQFFNLDYRPNATQTLELMASFAPFRSLATFHLWTRLAETDTADKETV